MAKSSGSTTTTQQPVGVNRRTLLRTGAHAAWAIPAVQIVTQSPALAATGGNPPPPADLNFGGTPSATWTGSGNNAILTVTMTIRNDGGTDSGAVTVNIGAPSSPKSPWSPTATTNSAGWSPQSRPASATHAFNHASLAPRGETTLSVVLKPTQANNAGTSVAGMTITATGAAAGAGNAIHPF